MKLSERVAYLKGLADGLELDAGAKSNKLLLAVIDVLEALTAEFGTVSAETETLSAKVGIVTDRLDEIEELMLAIEDFSGDDDDDDDEWCDCYDDDDDDELKIECTSCGEELVISEDDLFAGEIKCPKCGAKLDIDLEDGDDDDDGVLKF
jgi:DNA-directed RNA polymerase subunit RPC12/RpoP